jgi:hypothetical protein
MLETGFLSKIIGLSIYLGIFGYGLLTLDARPIQQYPPGHWENIIENQEFTETLNLDKGDDHTLIINAIFHDIDDNAINIRNVKDVYIKNCLIYDVGGDGIALRSSGGSQNVTIDGCTIYNTGRSGIIAKQRSDKGVNHTNLIIKNNTLYHNGETEHDHNVYVQATDSLIENNVMYGSSGNGISIRSSGIVRGNRIWDTQKSCIRYYNDHDPGPSNALYVENNICYQNIDGSSSAGINLTEAAPEYESWLVQNYYIRFNTVVLFTAKRYGFEVESTIFDPKHIELYGNLFINTEDISKTIKPQYVDYISSNYSSTSLKGFVNARKMPYDFQLTADSPARYYAATESRFPATDINGAARVAGYLDAGAHQFSVAPSDSEEAASN